MPTNNKTPNLGLNDWIGTDKPMRGDFTSDNLLLDNLLGGHLANSAVHFSEEDRTKLETPFACGLLGGTGTASNTHVLPFEPKTVLVFAVGKPLAEYDAANGYTVCNAGLVCQNGASAGMQLQAKSLLLAQSQTVPADKVFLNLNKNGMQYVYIAFR